MDIIDARNDSELLNSEIKKLSRTIHGQLKRMYNNMHVLEKLLSLYY